MAANRILAFSSSKAGDGGYLETAAPIIENFLGNKPLNIAFIPFAAVDENYHGYATNVRTALAHLPYTINRVLFENAKEMIEQADVIMVGGGNTFKLLHDIYACQILDTIRNKVNNGTSYIGWSAGSNITGPGIGTTNDMPIIAPKSFNALGLLPFQINPHYVNITQTNQQGETRNQRLEEFMLINPGLPIVAMPEGTALQLEGSSLKFIGTLSGTLFYWNENETIVTRPIQINEDLSFLL